MQSMLGDMDPHPSDQPIEEVLDPEALRAAERKCLRQSWSVVSQPTTALDAWRAARRC